MAKRLILGFLLIALSVSLAHREAQAALYRWIDKNGASHVTDYPPPNDEDTDTSASKEPEKTQPAEPKNAATPPPPAAKTEPQPTPAQNAATPPPPVVQASPPPAQPVPAAAATPRPVVKRKMPQTVKAPQKPKSFLSNIPIAHQTLMLISFVMLGLGILSYLVHMFFLYKIAVRLSVSKPWIAWIPVINIYTMVRAADKPLWWLLLVLVPIINIRFGLYLWMAICERLGINRKYGLLSLIFIIGPLLITASNRVIPQIAGNSQNSILIIFAVAAVSTLLTMVARAALPAICYWASNRVRRDTSAAYVPLGVSSMPDYEHDTVPFDQMNHGAASGLGATVGVAAGAAFMADTDAGHEGDDETVAIAKDSDDFTIEDIINEDLGAAIDDDRGVEETEAATLDPDAFTIEDDTPPAINEDGMASEQTPDDYDKDEGAGFSAGQFSLDDQPEGGGLLQPQGQEDDFSLDDTPEISLDDRGGERQDEIQPHEQASTGFEFDLELSADVPEEINDISNLEEVKLAGHEDIQLEAGQYLPEPDFSIEEDSGGEAVSLELDNFDSGKPLPDIDEAGLLHIDLPPEFSLDVSQETSELEIIDSTEEKEYEIPSEYASDLDFPIEDITGNLKIDTSDFKSLAEMVELEMSVETPELETKSKKEAASDSDNDERSKRPKGLKEKLKASSKPVAPHTAENEGLEDILISGLKLEKDDDDAHKENKP
ncbi:MAG: DUF5684 domain-containing protein [Candidatus Magnetominusculus sp. LBB02]|nr:DUF5684 domain-containing protein [Candidatus Magnetominusculus sp. LBB02]